MVAHVSKKFMLNDGKCLSRKSRIKQKLFVLNLVTIIILLINYSKSNIKYKIFNGKQTIFIENWEKSSLSVHPNEDRALL